MHLKYLNTIVLKTKKDQYIFIMDIRRKTDVREIFIVCHDQYIF